MKLGKNKVDSTKNNDVKLPEPHSSRSGTTYGYTVEARIDHYIPSHPVAIPRQHINTPLILTEEWQQVSFWKEQNPAGVPVADCSHNENLFNMHGLLCRGSAIALAYTLAAQLNKQSMIAIKIRIKQHKLTYSHKVFDEGEPEELMEHFGKVDKLFYDSSIKTNV